VELAEIFGEIELHPFVNLRVEGMEELLWLTNEHKEATPIFHKNGKPYNYILTWHTDMVYQEILSGGGLIRPIQVPPEGGETGLVNTANVYRALPPQLKDRIKGLEIHFTVRTNPAEDIFGDKDLVLASSAPEAEDGKGSFFPDLPDMIHPLVLVHPETGERTLNFSPYNAVRVMGLSDRDSEQLLRELYDFTTQPRIAYFHRWEKDGILIFDNLKTMHSARGLDPQDSRVMQRATIKGTEKTGRRLATKPVAA